METGTTFNIRGVKVIFTALKFGNNSAPHDHFELYSEFMGPTGYQSHFEPSASVSAQGGPERTAEDLITLRYLLLDSA